MANFKMEVKVTDLESFKKLAIENITLKLQLGKVLEAIGEGIPCPNAVELPIDADKCADTYCITCWEKALETVVEKTHPDGTLCSPEITAMMQNGTLCGYCGCYIGPAVGHTRYCQGREGCREEV